MASDGDGDSPWTRPGTFLAIAFLLVAVVGGGIALYRTHPDGTAAAAVPSVSAVLAVTAAASPSPAPSTTTAATGAVASPVASPTALPDQTVPVTAPPATWITVETLSLPTSPLYGPKIDDGTVMAGYQHSPTGALFADADNHGRFSITQNWQAATLSAVADTPGRAVFIAERKPYGIAAEPTPGELTQLVGFNFVSYTLDRATLQILREGSDGSLTTSTDTVIWQSNDWKILLNANGQDAPIASAPSSAGYVSWKVNAE